MTMTPVGPRCPDHAYVRAAGSVGQRVRMSMPRTQSAPLVTYALIATNVLVYLVTVAQGAGINAPGGEVFTKGILFGPLVAQGDWWRLFTAAFLHASLIHLGLNMLALYWLGSVVEMFLGLLIIEYQQTGQLAGQAMSLIVINLVFSFAIPNISYGGHIGGLIGGIAAALALSRFGRGHLAYGRPGVVGVGGLLVVGAVSVFISYWKVRGYA
jgi:membrane associated rhomboid family serine protease